MDKGQIEDSQAQILTEIKAAGIKEAEAPALDPKAKPGSPMHRLIDHTLLKPEAGSEDYAKLCREAVDWDLASVCIPPNRIAEVKNYIEGSNVLLCTVIGFPNGYQSTDAKEYEVKSASEYGCDEYDMVIPVGYVKDRNVAAVYDDVHRVVVAAKGKLVKVIIETALLTDEEKVFASVVSVFAGAHMLKTSTGFAGGGATIEDIKLLRQIAGDSRGVKAAGGIKTAAFAGECIQAGADRIGASSTGKILGKE